MVKSMVLIVFLPMEKITDIAIVSIIKISSANDTHVRNENDGLEY